jgi:hypothetical protein
MLDRKRTLVIFITTACLILSVALLFYLGTFAPIASEDKCNFFKKIHFGIMLRCRCLFGIVKEWQIDGPKQAHAFITKMGPSYETWDVYLDGHYFTSPVE